MVLDRHKISAILPMGGKSERFGSDTPKQFHLLGGKPLFLHALDIFLASLLFEEIVLPCHADWIDHAKQLLPASPLLRLIPGGRTRQESVYLGLQALGERSEVIVVHDAARPFVTLQVLMQNIEAALAGGAAGTYVPSTDTLAYAPDQKKIVSMPDRSHYWRAQTPQTFRTPLLLHAHRTTTRTSASDDCTLLFDQNHPVQMIRGEERNIKVTSAIDLAVAEQLLAKEELICSRR